MSENQTTRTVPDRVPDVTEVLGAFFDPDSSMVQLQYKSGDRVHEIRFPLEEIMKSEDWFIQIRKHIGVDFKRRRDHR